MENWGRWNLKTKTRTIVALVVFICINLNINVTSAQGAEGRNVSCANSDSQQVVAVITSPRITNWGNWGPWQYCPPCSFARGFQLSVEPNRHYDDDTALNAIRLICSDSRSTEIASLEGPWGTWRDKIYCPEGRQIYGADIKIEKPQGYYDDTAANDIDMHCSQGLLHSPMTTLYGRGGRWGKWYRSQRCPLGSYICGFKTQVEPNRGRGDDTALNNVDFACCKNQSSSRLRRRTTRRFTRG